MWNVNSSLLLLQFFYYSISQRGDLTITKVQAQNEGKYKCEAQNENGIQSVSAELKVVDGTTIISGPVPMSAQVER